jgi:hypothetical protein
MKQIFPSEFSDILNDSGLKILKGAGNTDTKAFLGFASNLVKKDDARMILENLEKYYYNSLQLQNTPIPTDYISRMKRNYSEQLGKTMKMKTIGLNSTRTRGYKIAAETGLITMLQSGSYKRMGEVLLGRKFGDPVGNQVICYENGGYVSPHNDHHPEDKHLKKGYYDIQLMFSNEYVAQQSLVYEENGYLNKAVDISTQSGIAVYKLPFWHYTTPLMGRKNYEAKARRWLLLGSFEIGDEF